MKTFIVLAFLAAVGFAAETVLLKAKPIYVELPVTRNPTATERPKIVGKVVLKPEESLIKGGSRPQPGADLRKAKPRYVPMPLNRSLTAAEWRRIVREVVLKPEESRIKIGSRPQTVLPLNIRLQNNALRFTSGAVAYRGQFPWQAAIIVDDSYFCGGVLISHRWVLTAAHCSGNAYYVRLGANRLDTAEYGSLDVTARYTEVYSAYNPTLLLDDLAVIYLSQCVWFSSYIAPARLPNQFQQSDTFVGESLRVSGWGVISDSGSGVSSFLEYSDLIGITNYECTRVFGRSITSSKLCATAFDDQTTCRGDAGGPLVFYDTTGYYILVGIVSFGSKSGCQFGNPVAFTRVTSYLTWLKPYADN